jgi:hypothetical protein
MREPTIIIPSQWATCDGPLGAYFVAQALHKELKWYVVEHWPTAVTELHADDRGQVFSAHGVHESIVEFDNSDSIAYIRLARGAIVVTVAARWREPLEQFFNLARARYPLDNVREGKIIPMVFWTQSPHGPQHWRRNMEVPSWPDITNNYPGLTFSGLREMMTWTKPERGGQLLLWYGPPGTGKTWAIRALASEWRKWCQFEYITDPDELFKDASYLIQVLLRETDDNDNGKIVEESTGLVKASQRWRCFVLEDTGELLVVDAKKQQGQALSRLLNVVDGLLGQGLNILLLITTNEEIKTLHPAVIRPGRCLLQVEFGLFNVLEAQDWLNELGHTGGATGMMTLAQLYHYAMAFPLKQQRKKEAGFTK